MVVTKEQVIQRISGGQTVLLNVLAKEDYKKLHIAGSENHPMTADPVEFSRSVQEKYGKGKGFVLYGDHFGLLESYLATKALVENGLKAENYSGGVQEWLRAGLPVEGTSRGPSPAPAVR